jgi:acylphosphatase
MARTGEAAMTSEARDIKRLRISGGVQKIGYRVWCEREALALGLKGWVRNRLDGTVEVLIAGSPDAVTAMIARCRSGPPLAKVEAVDVEKASVLDLGYRRPGEAFSLLATA